MKFRSSPDVGLNLAVCGSMAIILAEADDIEGFHSRGQHLCNCLSKQK